MLKKQHLALVKLSGEQKPGTGRRRKRLCTIPSSSLMGISTLTLACSANSGAAHNLSIVTELTTPMLKSHVVMRRRRILPHGVY